MSQPPLLLPAYLQLHIRREPVRAVPLQLHDDLGGLFR